MSRSEKLDRARFCLQRVGLEGVDRKYPSELSGGMQKRVGIARAIALNPQYLFCDEPNSGLDPQTSVMIDRLIQEITQEYGITTVINTHDMNSVMEIGDKVIFIYKGENTGKVPETASWRPTAGSWMNSSSPRGWPGNSGSDMEAEAHLQIELQRLLSPD